MFMNQTPRVLAVLVALGAVLIAAVLALWPATISILGTDLSCGAPAVTALSDGSASTELGRAFEEECVNLSATRLTIGWLVGSLGLCAAGVLWYVGRRRPQSWAATGLQNGFR
jgi:hypothetical protein